MRREFLVNRQGKDFVLYAGLLDQAHQEGLSSMKTSLVQIPNEANSYMAIVMAEVQTAKGFFTGIGDASPENVDPMFAPHLIRMAETRAKARALRDAINVGITALEELGGGASPIEEERVPYASNKSHTHLAGSGALLSTERTSQQEYSQSARPQTSKAVESAVRAERVERAKQPEQEQPVLSTAEGAALQSPAPSTGPVATLQQIHAIKNLCKALGRTDINADLLSQNEAEQFLTTLSREYKDLRKRRAS